METEKVCVNLSAAELGTIDVLVAQGLYTSRSDLIRAVCGRSPRSTSRRSGARPSTQPASA